MVNKNSMEQYYRLAGTYGAYRIGEGVSSIAKLAYLQGGHRPVLGGGSRVVVSGMG